MLPGKGPVPLFTTVDTTDPAVAQPRIRRLDRFAHPIMSGGWHEWRSNQLILSGPSGLEIRTTDSSPFPGTCCKGCSPVSLLQDLAFGHPTMRLFVETRFNTVSLLLLVHRLKTMQCIVKLQCFYLAPQPQPPLVVEGLLELALELPELSALADLFFSNWLKT